MKERVAFILLSGVPRLALHFGALHRCFQLYLAGLIPKPYVMIGSSAGAMASLSCLAYTEENFERVIDILINLKPKDVKKIPWSVKFEIGAAVLAMLSPILPLKRSLSRKSDIVLHALEALTALGIVRYVGNDILSRPYIYSNEPLRKLLREKLSSDTQDSDIRLEIMATDRDSGEQVFYSNQDRGANVDSLVSWTLASARLNGFPLEKIDGRYLTDAAVFGDLPIHRALANNCDAIVVFQYTSDNGIFRGNNEQDLITDIQRDLRISRNRIRILAMTTYLKELAKDSSLPPIFVIKTDTPVPDMDIKDFTREKLSRGVEIGYQSVLENEKALVDFLG